MYIHGLATGSVKRGVQLNSASTAIIDSHVSDCHVDGQDAQAVGGWNGPGPYKIANNRLEGSGENILFGGADARIADLVPSDIEITQNHVTKPLAWKTDDPSYAGTHYTVKNILELKSARRVLVTCNVFENNWLDAQVGFGIVLTPRNQDGSAPWSTLEDITFAYNLVRHSASAVNILGTDDNHSSGQAKRILVANNVFDDIDASRWGGSGHLVQVIDGPADVKVDHNTALQSGHVISADGKSAAHFLFTNNIAPHNRYGVFGSGQGSGNKSLATYFPAAKFQANALVALPPEVPSTSYPGGNFFPPSLDDVGFVARPTDLRLLPTSPLAKKGTDAQDLGADVAGLTTRLAGVTP
jgi:hypothetical protein